MMRAAVILSVMFAGCAPVVSQPPGPSACAPPGYRSLVGRNLATVTVPGDLDLRIIQPGEAVTQDFRAERLNFVVDGQGVIGRVYCG